MPLFTFGLFGIYIPELKIAIFGVNEGVVITNIESDKSPSLNFLYALPETKITFSFYDDDKNQSREESISVNTVLDVNIGDSLNLKRDENYNFVIPNPVHYIFRIIVSILIILFFPIFAYFGKKRIRRIKEAQK